MPLYEYQCQQCDELIEALQKMSDPPLTTCESCGGDLKRLVSSPAFQFKGSGWYVTDYAKSGGEKSSEKGAAGDAKPKSSDGAASSSAPSTKTESSSTATAASSD